MKRSLLLVIFIFFYCGYHSFAQQVMNDIAKTYFRSNPYKIEFGRFLDHLLNDPTLVNKKMEKRTDTGFFYFKGQYTSHNPFPFKALRTEVLLTETVEQIPDSIPRADTFFVYQLLAYTAGGKQGLEDVKKEYARFDRRFRNSFGNSEAADLTDNDQNVGVVRNYFLHFYSLSPVTSGWGVLKGKNENVFVVTLRLKR